MCASHLKRERRSVRVRGIVQGVGFRPFVFRLAEEEHLAGWVLNDSLGVLCEVEGTHGHLDRFERRLTDDAPPLARVLGVESEPREPTGESGFVIRPSDRGDARTTLISPDVATCDDCLRELNDPADRRYRYPFINCTNCGPRYTIIRDVPYDRPKTTMQPFTMCEACQREYDDPRDRRFHAQPNACPDCGPRLILTDRSGRHLRTADVINRAASFLHEGQVVAVKGLGGFHLACDATNAHAVTRLRERKYREEKPLAVMAPSVEVVETFAEVRPEDRRLLESPERPIVLLPRKQPSAVADAVAPHSRYFGVMLPYTPVHHLLLAEGFDALVMTSGNLSDEPICKSNDEALERLRDVADYFLLNDREIHVTSDDSVVRADAGGLRQM
ncbi:MAG TPA: Sua5/YciO/YrdC/YwlC family protein, partial [Planctomycetota bacterium]|nr:Sua5/YciO/YrdC/YwlC family protein [Planctomycetota bacterium]